MSADTDQAGCGKPCGGGCCRQKCEIGCDGDETFGRDELIRRMLEYRDQLRAELASVERAVAELQAAAEEPAQ